MEVADVKIHRANLEAAIKELIADFEVNSGAYISNISVIRSLPLGERNSRVQVIICEVVL